MTLEEIVTAIETIDSEVDTAIAETVAEGRNPKEVLLRQGVQWFSECKQLSDEVKAMDQTDEVVEVKTRVHELARKVSRNLIGFDSEEK